MRLQFVLCGRDARDFGQSIFSTLSRNIPFIEEHLDKAYECVRLAFTDINNMIDVVLHVSTDISDLSNMVDGFHRFIGHPLWRSTVANSFSKPVYLSV